MIAGSAFSLGWGRREEVWDGSWVGSEGSRYLYREESAAEA